MYALTVHSYINDDTDFRCVISNGTDVEQGTVGQDCRWHVKSAEMAFIIPDPKNYNGNHATITLGNESTLSWSGSVTDTAGHTHTDDHCYAWTYGNAGCYMRTRYENVSRYNGSMRPDPTYGNGNYETWCDYFGSSLWYPDTTDATGKSFKWTAFPEDFWCGVTTTTTTQTTTTTTTIPAATFNVLKKGIYGGETSIWNDRKITFCAYDKNASAGKSLKVGEAIVAGTQYPVSRQYYDSHNLTMMYTIPTSDFSAGKFTLTKWDSWGLAEEYWEYTVLDTTANAHLDTLWNGDNASSYGLEFSSAQLTTWSTAGSTLTKPTTNGSPPCAADPWVNENACRIVNMDSGAPAATKSGLRNLVKSIKEAPSTSFLESVPSTYKLGYPMARGSDHWWKVTDRPGFNDGNCVLATHTWNTVANGTTTAHTQNTYVRTTTKSNNYTTQGASFNVPVVPR